MNIISLRVFNSKMAACTVDDVLSNIGQSGRAQKRFYKLLGFVHFTLASQYFLVSFAEYSGLEWNCVNIADHNRVAHADVPLEERCRLLESGQCFPDFPSPVVTTVTEWNLLCLTDHLIAVPQSAFFLGCVLGSLLSAVVSYCLSRRLVLYVAIFFVTAFGVLSALAVVFTMYVVTRFCLGIFVQMSMSVSNTWMLELTMPKFRNYTTTYMALFSIAGAAWLPLIFSVLLDWRWAEGFLSLLALIPLSYLWLIPESPSWLMSCEYVDDTKHALQHIAELNQTELPSCELTEGHKPPTKSLPHLILYPEMAIRTLVLLVCWCTCYITYYGVTFAVGDRLGGSRYYAFFLVVAVEMPALCSGVYLAKKYGRRYTLPRVLLMSTVFLVSCKIVSDSLANSSPILSASSRVGFAIAGKFTTTTAFTVVCFYATELLPTEVRGVGIVFFSVTARLCGVMLPTILHRWEQASVVCWLGVLCAFAGLCALVLPETRGRVPPDTIESIRFRKFKKTVSSIDTNSVLTLSSAGEF